jgi:hypothetical protein
MKGRVLRRGTCDVLPTRALFTLPFMAGEGLSRIVLAALLSLVSPALAQESGWHYSPLPGEGDRAALGCSYGANAQNFTCLAVRCEDDFAVGVHIHTSRADGDAGKWVLAFDEDADRIAVTAVADGSPYHARIEGDVAALLERIRNSGVVYLEPERGPPTERAISLNGSLYAINQALYFCAPKVAPPSGDEVAPVDGQDGAGDEAGEG